MTQGDVAEAIGITQSAYSQLEIGNTARSKYTAEIGNLLGVSSYWLATGKGRMSAHQSDARLNDIHLDNLISDLALLTDSQRELVLSVVREMVSQAKKQE